MIGVLFMPLNAASWPGVPSAAQWERLTVGSMADTVRSALDWVFRDRRTGRIVIAQLPNIPLAAGLLCIVLRWLVHPSGRGGTVLSVVGTIALVIWAGDELVRGVNPFRRALGAGVLLALLLGWALSG